MSQNALKRRTSSSASTHGGPKWMRDRKSHESVLNPRRSPRPLTTLDMDHVDNFSYDPDQLPQFRMPDGLDERLPTSIRVHVHDWQKSGAAVCTALNRTEQTANQGVKYAYPDSASNPISPYAHLSRRPSTQASEGATASPTPLNLASPTPLSPESLAPLEKLATEQSRKHALVPPSPLGMETPPFSPIDVGSPSPAALAHPTKTSLPELSRLDTSTTHLTSFTSSSDEQDLATPIDGFDHKGWEYFLGKCENEIRDNKEALTRFTGYARKIEIEKMELARELKPEVKLAMMDFAKWWEGMKPKVSKLSERVEALVVPRLEEVNLEMGVAGLSFGEINTRCSNPRHSQRYTSLPIDGLNCGGHRRRWGHWPGHRCQTDRVSPVCPCRRHQPRPAP